MSNITKEYKHFCHVEIVSILQMREKGVGFREIGKWLGRGENAGGSIKRFLDANKHPFPGISKNLDVHQRARAMYEQAQKRRKIPRKKSKLESDPELKEKVIELLVNEQASPRDISFRIPDELPGKSIAYTTIYQFTKTNRRDLREHHRLKGKERQQRVKRKGNSRKKGAPAKTNIDQRPPWVWDRTEFGHYEADTMHSCKNGSGFAILTVREMKSRRRWYFRIADLKAETTLAVLQGFFRQMPLHMRRTLTVDNGPENEHLYKLEKVFPGLRVYYCDPYCAWQRGSVENANKDFRWYHPKGTDFKNVSPEEVWSTQDKLNRRRMLCLKGKSAEMVFQNALNHPPQIHVVGPEVLSSKKALFEAVDLHFEQSSGLYLPSPAQWGLSSSGSESSGIGWS
jgi:IS30 family transposase